MQNTIFRRQNICLSPQHHLEDHFQWLSTMKHQNLWHPVRHQTMTLTLTLKYLSHQYHLPMNPQNLPEMVTEDWKEG